MAAYTRKELLDAVVSALSPMLIENGGTARTVVLAELEKPGELTSKISVPALAVAFVSSKCRPGPYLGYIEEIGVKLTAVARYGITPDPLSLLEDLRPRLIGKDLGEGTMPLKLLGESPLTVQEGFAYASANYLLVRHLSLDS